MSKLKQWLDKFDQKYESIVDAVLVVTEILFIIYGIFYLTMWSK